jgi:prevent-host-death family protein
MPTTYSTFDAKARFSEVLRRVRAGETVVITSHGRPCAEIRPIERPPETLAARLERLRREGRIVPAAAGRGAARLALRPVARRRGALERFLAERD